MSLKKMIIFLTLFILTSIMSGFEDSESEENVANKIANYYVESIEVFEANVKKLSLLEAQGLPEKELKSTFLQTRESYKYNEFLLNYVTTQKSKKFNAPNLVVSSYLITAEEELKDPHGLQVIEDLIYNPTKNSRAKLQHEILLLKDLVEDEVRRLKRNKVRNPKFFIVIVLDALRMEIYRIEALGIVGFDVPDSKNAIPEAIAALTSLNDITAFLKPLLKRQDDQTLFLFGQEKLKSAISYLAENNDFDQLDRLHFLDNFLHPISTWLKNITIALDYQYPSNTNAYDREAEHLFSPNALNKDVFAFSQSDQVFQLGKKLFNETLLSSNNTRSCATCHNPKLGFADGLTKNMSIDSSQVLLRNTPTLINVGYQTRFFYDSKATTLERQSVEVIHNRLEMGVDLDKLIDTLLFIPEYIEMFDKAFVGPVTPHKLAQALTEYVSSIKSTNSKLDQYFLGDKNALNESEKNGFNLFAGKAKCATCHFFPMFNGLVPPHFVDTESEIIGVPASIDNQSEIDSDRGRIEVTGLSIHEFSFKTPGLRNIELTAPYMHNGVFKTLEEVVEFYNNGGGVGQGMDLPTQTLPTDSLHLSKQEKIDLVNFMKALTEEKFVY